MTPTVIPQSCNAWEYATMLSEYQTAVGKKRQYSDATLHCSKAERSLEHPNTDWYSELVKKWTTTMRHNFTINGGTRGMNYFLSLGTKSDAAMYKESSTKYHQYNVRGKFDLPSPTG